MARPKLAGKRKQASNAAQMQKYTAGIPCLLVILGGMAAVFTLMYFAMQSAGR